MIVAPTEFELEAKDRRVRLMRLVCLMNEGGELCASVTHATVEHAEVLRLLAHAQEALQLTERVEADRLLSGLTIAHYPRLVGTVSV